MKKEIELDSESMEALVNRGRSHSFGGNYKKGEAVRARCGEISRDATVDRAGRHSWVLKEGSL